MACDRRNEEEARTSWDTLVLARHLCCNAVEFRSDEDAALGCAARG